MVCRALAEHYPIMYHLMIGIMNMKRIMIALLICSSTIASAQQQRIKEEGKTVFKPHWLMQLQAGAAHTVGEAKFADLLSPAAALNIGYKFSPIFGVRAGASGWQAKGAWVSPKQIYDFKYLQGNIDLMADLSTIFCGFSPKRVFNAYLFAGAGFNHAFDNDEANALNTAGYQPEYLWNGSKNSVTGRFGLGCNLRLNDRLAINIEGNANALSDKFNSKKAGNCDWQINALVGLTIKFGKGYTRTTPVYYPEEPVKEQPAPQPIVEQAKPIENTAVEVSVEPMEQSIFFAINSARILEDQQTKVNELATYLNKHPESKVCITGYADKGTGTARYNKVLSEKRAASVAEALKAKGISAERIQVEFKGDTVQPYGTATENRVSICLVES